MVTDESGPATFPQRMYLYELRVRLGDTCRGLHGITMKQAAEEIDAARRKLAAQRGPDSEQLLDPDFEELAKITRTINKED